MYDCVHYCLKSTTLPLSDITMGSSKHYPAAVKFAYAFIGALKLLLHSIKTRIVGDVAVLGLIV